MPTVKVHFCRLKTWHARESNSRSGPSACPDQRLDLGKVICARYPWRLEWFYTSCRLTLKVARGAMAEMPIGVKPGFGILLLFPPWRRNE